MFYLVVLALLIFLVARRPRSRKKRRTEWIAM